MKDAPRLMLHCEGSCRHDAESSSQLTFRPLFVYEIRMIIIIVIQVMHEPIYEMGSHRKLDGGESRLHLMTK